MMKNSSMFKLTGLFLVLPSLLIVFFSNTQELPSKVENIRSISLIADKPDQLNSPFSISTEQGLVHLESADVGRVLASDKINNKKVNTELDNAEFLTSIDSLTRRFEAMTYIDSPNFSMEERIRIEEEILDFFSQNQNVMSQLLSNYEQSNDHNLKFVMIDMVSMIEHKDVEQFALKQINKDFDDYTESWLKILRSTGITSTKDRATMLLKLSQFSDPVLLSDALSALNFQPIPYEKSEKELIVSRVSVYLTHENAQVRQAAKRTIENWTLDTRVSSMANDNSG